MHEDKITVIIPVYNMEKYIERCLLSVCNNTYKNLQIICINDGSTDGTIDILNRFKQKDDRIYIIDKENGGVSKARNCGLKKAVGDYIAFVDSDDWIHHQYFEKLLNAAKSANVDVISCRYIRTDSEKKEEELPESAPKEIDISDIGNMSNIRKYIWGKLYKKEILSNIFFKENLSFAEDTLFNMNVFLQKKNIRIFELEQELYYYFNREDSVVHKIQTIHIYYVVEEYLKYIESGELNNKKLEIIVEQTLKSILSYRYLSMFEEDKAVLKKRCNKVIQSCWLNIRNNHLFSTKKRFIYKVFTSIPLSYRVFRILADKTMLDLEKNRKQRKNKTVKSVLDK